MTVVVADVVNARVGDTIDDVPVIAGAFVDPAAADVPNSDSAAGRARRCLAPAPSVTRGRRRHERPSRPHHDRDWSWKPWVITAGIVVLLAAALAGTYLWTQSQYFVGRADSDVAIYKGVNTEFGPVKFFNVYQVSDLQLTDLNPAVRSQVRDGIPANNRGDAESIITSLRGQQLPLCRTDQRTSPSPTPSRDVSSTRCRHRRPSRPHAARRRHVPASSPCKLGAHADVKEFLRASALQRVRARRPARSPGTSSLPAQSTSRRPRAARPRRQEVARPGRNCRPMSHLVNPAQRIPTRRNIELLLIVFAVLIVVAAEAAVEAAQYAHISSRLLTYAAVPLVAGVITHLVIRRVAPYADPLLLPAVVLLNGLGLVMIHRIDIGTEAAWTRPRASPSRRRGSDPGGVDRARRGAVPRDPAGRARSPGAAALRLHPRADRSVPAAAAGGAARTLQRGERRAHLDPCRRVLAATGRVREGAADDLRRVLPGAEARRALAGRAAVPGHRLPPRT